METNPRSIALLALPVILSLLLASCSQKSAEPAKNPGLEEAVGIATDAYIYGYPLVTMDMTRRQLTNVSVPDAAHAPMGQVLRLRTYPAVDNHVVTAPNADTLYTMAWLDVSKEPWVFSIPDMGDRYYLMPMLDGYTNKRERGKRTTGDKAQKYAITDRMSVFPQSDRYVAYPHWGSADLLPGPKVIMRVALGAGQGFGSSAQLLRQAVHARSNGHRRQLRHEGRHPRASGGAQRKGTISITWRS